MTNLCCSPKKGGNVETASQSKEREKRKQKDTASVARKKGGDLLQKRNGH